jgi:tetratricopeptide (TPR) repeat protein
MPGCASTTRRSADFSKAIELEPNNSLAYRNRALAYRKLGDMQKAQEDLQYMIRLERAESAWVTDLRRNLGPDRQVARRAVGGWPVRRRVRLHPPLPIPARPTRQTQR